MTTLTRALVARATRPCKVAHPVAASIVASGRFQPAAICQAMEEHCGGQADLAVKRSSNPWFMYSSGNSTHGLLRDELPMDLCRTGCLCDLACQLRVEELKERALEALSDAAGAVQPAVAVEHRPQRRGHGLDPHAAAAQV